MDILIKKATIEDIDDILNNRMDFLYQVIGKKPSDEFMKATLQFKYLTEEMCLRLL